MKIDEFNGIYRYLSNFYPSIIKYEGFSFPTAEHLYQAAKCMNPVDVQSFIECKTPGEAKRLGSKVIIKENWNDIRLGIMTEIIKMKFDQNTSLQMSLLTTGNIELIEGNTWGDKYWGVCNGVGENHLGKILMAYRDSLNIKGI